MSLLNSLGLLLAKSTSFARYFLALSFALTAISIAACSGDNTKTTDTTAADKKKCEDDGDTWDDTKAAGKKCVKSDTTANGTEEDTEEDGGETTTGTENATFTFTFATEPDAGFTTKKVDLTAKLDVDGTGDGQSVDVVGFSVVKKGTTGDDAKTLTFTLEKAGLDKVTAELKDLTTDTAKNTVVLTLTKDESVELTGKTLFTFLKGLSTGTTFDDFAGTEDTTEGELASLLTKLDGLFAASGT